MDDRTVPPDGFGGMEVGIRYRIILWHRPHVLPKGGIDILGHGRRALPCAAAAGTLQLYNIQRELVVRLKSRYQSMNLITSYANSLSPLPSAKKQIQSMQTPRRDQSRRISSYFVQIQLPQHPFLPLSLFVPLRVRRW